MYFPEYNRKPQFSKCTWSLPASHLAPNLLAFESRSSSAESASQWAPKIKTTVQHHPQCYCVQWLPVANYIFYIPIATTWSLSAWNTSGPWEAQPSSRLLMTWHIFLRLLLNKGTLSKFWKLCSSVSSVNAIPNFVTKTNLVTNIHTTVVAVWSRH